MTISRAVSLKFHSDASGPRVLFGYVLADHLRQDLIWRFATSKFVVGSFISFLWMVCTGTCTSVSVDSHLLHIKNWILVSLSPCPRFHVEQYNAFELPHGSICYTRHSFHAYRSSQQSWLESLLVDLAHLWIQVWTEKMGWDEGRTRSKPTRKWHEAGGGKSFEVPTIFLEGKSMSRWNGMLQLCQFLTTQDPVDLNKSLVAAPEEMATFEVLAGDLATKPIGTWLISPEVWA